MRLPQLLAAALLCGLGTRAVAHDYWIEPATYRPALGAQVALTLRVGVDMSGDSQPYITHWFSRFVVVGPDGERAVSGEMGDDPAGQVRIAAPGVHVVGYRSTRDYAKIDAPKFARYLAEEGLEGVAARRAARGESQAPAREFYSRCAKSVLATPGAEAAAGFDVDLGFTLELIPERNPYALVPGATLPVRLRYLDGPLAGALVQAFTRDRPGDKVRVRTDAEGRARLVLPHAGEWLVKAVHMIENTDTEDVEWESYWASVTFRVAPPSGH